MPVPKKLRIAALINLPRTQLAGGHVKCWERLAIAAAHSSLPLDLTVYFSGAERTEILGPHARLRQLPPVFSTAKLKFLPYVPDHTDLANYHPKLARELKDYDLIHTTDGFFAFARTAERVSQKYDIPLVTSFHTDTPAYTRIFTQQTIERLFRIFPRLSRRMVHGWKLPERQGATMERKLEKHLSLCAEALVTRDEDHELADAILGNDHVHHMRLGVDKAMFGPYRCDREGIEAEYAIPANRILILFVGRVDVGKNIYTLVNAMKQLVDQGVPLHLITAGVGPALQDVRDTLKDHCSTPGYVDPDDLARLYASVDALALSSEVEIRSMAAVEAIASGCPVIVSEKSGVAQLFHETPAMQVVAGGTEKWAEALLAFEGSWQKRKAMHDAAVQYSRDHLASWHDVLAEDLFSVWAKVAVSRQWRQRQIAAA